MQENYSHWTFSHERPFLLGREIWRQYFTQVQVEIDVFFAGLIGASLYIYCFLKLWVNESNMKTAFYLRVMDRKPFLHAVRYWACFVYFSLDFLHGRVYLTFRLCLTGHCGKGAFLELFWQPNSVECFAVLSGCKLPRKSKLGDRDRNPEKVFSTLLKFCIYWSHFEA